MLAIRALEQLVRSERHNLYLGGVLFFLGPGLRGLSNLGTVVRDSSAARNRDGSQGFDRADIRRGELPDEDSGRLGDELADVE